MNTSLKRLAALCAGTMLLACADLAQRVQGPEPVPSAASANDSYVVGRSQHMARRYGPAIASYMAALKADPAHVNARNGLAALYAEQGEFAKAIPIWEQLTLEASAKPGPESAFLFSNLGYAHFLNGQYDSALSALEKACMLDPLNHRAWQHLGSALEKLGQDERAQHMYKQARALQEHDFKADYALAPKARVAAIESAVQAGASQEQGWDATEVRQTASGMFELRRVPGPPPPRQKTLPVALQALLPENKANLEIRNGNGVTGMAKALSQKMDSASLRVVRLSNQKGFNVRQTRVEYQSAFRDAAERLAERFGNAKVVQVDNCRSADMRLIIGRDLINGKFALRPASQPEPASFVQDQTRSSHARQNEGKITHTPGA
jgi:hypothetical protein